MSSNNSATKSNNNLLSKIFRRSSKPDISDSTSTTSGETLIQKEPMKSTFKEEYDSVSDLMAKANTMSEEEFKNYLKDHKEEVEAAYRKQGGGIASGEWISSDYTTGKSPLYTIWLLGQ